MISYQIYKFNPDSGNISVLFKLDNKVIASYNVDVPLTDGGLFITGEELNSYLLRMFPQHIVDRQNRLDAGISNADEIASLVVPIEETAARPAPNPLSDTEKMWIEFEHEKSIAKVLVKFGVLATDPTEIPTANL
jgi:hypothetical protein